MNSPFAQSWQPLQSNGYHVLPIGPDTKAPSEYRGGRWYLMSIWQQFRQAPAPEMLARVWSTWPGANIGILTGTPTSDGHVLACVDFDTDDIDELELLQSSIPLSPVQKKGRRGYSAFYQAPIGTVGFRTSLVELLTDTRQTVVPGSIHPDTGKPYVWSGRETLADVACHALPVLNADDLERFRDTIEQILPKQIAAPRTVMVAADDPDAPLWRRINTAAYNNLEKWVPDLGLPKLRRDGTGYKAVAHWRASSSGRPISQRNTNLSIMFGLGARDFGKGESYTALNLVAAALAVDADTAFQWLGSRLGFVDDVPFVVPVKVTSLPLSQTIAVAHDPETGEIIEPPQSSDELPDELTRVPGLVGGIIDWIDASNRKPNRTLALGTALTVLGTLVGQAIAGPTGSATHLYVVCVGPSGIGKEYPKNCCTTLLEACNAGALIGPSDFKSSSGLVNFLKRKPVSLCAVDEMGMMLGRILGPHAKAHDAEISAVLREIWGKNFSAYRTPEWAAVQSQSIEAPGLSFYGSSTMEELFNAMGGKDVINGFLNRWFILPTNKRTRGRKPRVAPHVPEFLALALAECRNWAHRVTEAALAAPIGSYQPKKVLGWGAGSEALWDEFEGLTHELQGGASGVFYARTAEMALRLASIRAAGRKSDQIEVADFIWARDLSLWSANRMKALAQGNIAENDTQRLHNRIISIMAENKGAASHSHIVQRLRGSVKSRDVKDAFELLLTGGNVTVSKAIPPAGGPPTITYKLVEL